MDICIVEEKIDRIFSSLIELRRRLHSYPEIGFQEFETSASIVDWLKSCNDIEITSNLVGTGVIALIRGAHPGPTIGLRADIDALEIQDEKQVSYASQKEGICHACGHDVHTVIGLGLASVLSQMKDDMHGNVKIIFQPSEESPVMDEVNSGADSFSECAMGRSAAELVIEAGVLENPKVDRLLGIHCWPTLEVGTMGYQYGVAMASAANFHISIQGKSAHAARPHESIDPMTAVAQLILALQTLASRRVDPNSPFVLTVATIKGGTKRYAISNNIDLTGTVRACDEKFLNKDIYNYMLNIIKGVCEGNESKYIFEYSGAFTPVVNDDTVVKESIEALEGLDCVNAVQLREIALTSDDFSCYSKRVPAFYMKLGTAGKDESTRYPLHNPLFDVDERCIKVGIVSLSKIMLDYLAN